jgi:hypothetical protein
MAPVPGHTYFFKMLPLSVVNMLAAEMCLTSHCMVIDTSVTVLLNPRFQLLNGMSHYLAYNSDKRIYLRT